MPKEKAQKVPMMFDCARHWYLDGFMIIVGLLYLLGLDGWGLIPSFKMSLILPFMGTLFLFFGIKTYMKHHTECCC